MRKIVLSNVIVASLISTIAIFTVGCQKLEKVKGCKVVDHLTGQPLAGVKVIANATSDLESEQSYLHVETITNINGSYDIKGLPGKYYSIHLIKEGYQASDCGVSISTEGTKICRNKSELYPNLPHSDREYNVYDPSTKKIIKKIDQIKSAGRKNYGWGDVRYLYDKKLVESVKQINQPQYILRVHDINKGGSNTGYCRTHYISRLVSLSDRYEISKENKNSYLTSKMKLIYSYKEGKFYKALYRFPHVSKGYYQLGHAFFKCGGVDYLINIK